MNVANNLQFFDLKHEGFSESHNRNRSNWKNCYHFVESLTVGKLPSESIYISLIKVL